MYSCDWSTGKLNLKNSSIVSNVTGAPPVHNNTGLTSVMMGTTESHAFYHAADMSIHHLTLFTNINNGQWTYAGAVDKDTPSNTAIFCQYSSTRNMSLIYPRDGANIGVARFNIDNSWHICETPVLALPVFCSFTKKAMS